VYDTSRSGDEYVFMCRLHHVARVVLRAPFLTDSDEVDSSTSERELPRIMHPWSIGSCIVVSRTRVGLDIAFHASFIASVFHSRQVPRMDQSEANGSCLTIRERISGGRRGALALISGVCELSAEDTGDSLEVCCLRDNRLRTFLDQGDIERDWMSCSFCYIALFSVWGSQI
jgi:hypothetical protein